MPIFAYFQNIKYAYIGGEGVKKAPNCAYVIYEWYLLETVISPMLLYDADHGAFEQHQGRSSF
jgi:hypothetical protein